MIFRTMAYLTCTICNTKKTFIAEADVVVEKITDSKEIKNWNDISLYPLDFKGICPNCIYDKAA